ncbi:MAG TPA: proton-conducting transporter membrane subunit, partial [Candidatus Binataceae bacterium]|nr:proton-conducting transporter membrane subunit [Candidatus Binataceae bacterium]
GILLSLAVRPAHQGIVLACLGSLAAVAAVAAGAEVLLTGDVFIQPLWSLSGTTLTLRLDVLSSAFVLVAGLVLLPASIYAGGELRRKSFCRQERAFTVLLLALYASVVLILLAGDALLFLLAWELMSILCYLLVMTSPNRENGQVGSGYLMLAMGEAGALAATLGFLVLALHASSLEFGALKTGASALGANARWAVFLLTFFGFGVKAGLVPVNSWLRPAYAAAPGAFAPVLAGATLNLGLYGILRVNADIMPAMQAGAGLLALIVGTASALIGILYATIDNDLKGMLAHSSIENAGIVVAASGAGMVFVATNHPTLAAIAFVAALYHMINHSLYKTLLFFGVGAVEKQTGTRDMDRLGGLIKWMPLTALGFLVGTLSIAALPPFNGFVSEWLTLQVMLRSAELSSTGAKIVFALCGAALALTAALAVTCFVKVFAMSFLGMRRLEEKRVTEASPAALASMAILAVLCLALGVLPTYVIPMLNPASSQLTGASASDALVPPFFASAQGHGSLPEKFIGEFHDLGAQVGQDVLPGRGLVVLHRGGTENPVVFAMSTSYMLLVLIGLLLLVYVVIRLWLTRSRLWMRRERWDGGVRRLLPEMTYTATGFSNPVRVIFDAIFRPTTVEDTRETVAQHFRMAIRREKERVHLVDRLVLQPFRSATLLLARSLAAMHHGRINAYTAYVLLALLLALAAGLGGLGGR